MSLHQAIGVVLEADSIADSIQRLLGTVLFHGLAHSLDKKRFRLYDMNNVLQFEKGFSQEKLPVRLCLCVSAPGYPSPSWRTREKTQRFRINR